MNLSMIDVYNTIFRNVLRLLLKKKRECVKAKIN